jgi:hypothetical protein
LTARDVAETGSAPELGTPLSLAAARELAVRALREARSGTDPCAAKQRKRQEERAAESDTLAAVAAEYLKREGKNLRTVTQREADLKLVTDVLGRLPAADIKRSQFVRIFDDIADTRGEVRSDRVLSAMKTLLTWHSGRGDGYTSVLVGTKKRTSSKERERTRILTDDELRAVWRAAEADDGPYGPFVRLVLLTATRRNEAAGMERRELSEDGKVWVIPAVRWKNGKGGKDMVVPLSPAAQEIVASMPDLGPFVFGHDGAPVAQLHRPQESVRSLRRYRLDAARSPPHGPLADVPQGDRHYPRHRRAMPWPHHWRYARRLRPIRVSRRKASRVRSSRQPDRAHRASTRRQRCDDPQEGAAQEAAGRTQRQVAGRQFHWPA